MANVAPDRGGGGVRAYAYIEEYLKLAAAIDTPVRR